MFASGVPSIKRQPVVTANRSSIVSLSYQLHFPCTVFQRKWQQSADEWGYGATVTAWGSVVEVRIRRPGRARPAFRHNPILPLFALYYERCTVSLKYAKTELSVTNHAAIIRNHRNSRNNWQAIRIK